MEVKGIFLSKINIDQNSLTKLPLSEGQTPQNVLCLVLGINNKTKTPCDG